MLRQRCQDCEVMRGLSDPRAMHARLTPMALRAKAAAAAALQRTSWNAHMATQEATSAASVAPAGHAKGFEGARRKNKSDATNASHSVRSLLMENACILNSKRSEQQDAPSVCTFCRLRAHDARVLHLESSYFVFQHLWGTTPISCSNWTFFRASSAPVRRK